MLLPRNISVVPPPSPAITADLMKDLTSFYHYIAYDYTSISLVS